MSMWDQLVSKAAGLLGEATAENPPELTPQEVPVPPPYEPTQYGSPTETFVDPFNRTVQDTADSYQRRIDTVKASANDPRDSWAETGAHGLLQGGGMVFDTLSAPFAYALDVVVPKTKGEEALNSVMREAFETDIGKEALDKWEALDPQTKRRLSSAAVPLEAALSYIGLKGGLNAVSRNAWTNVRNFYSGNPVKKMEGVVNAFVTRGVPATVKQAYTPTGQALLRQGLTQGKADEIVSTAAAVRHFATIQKKLQANNNKPNTLTSEELVSYQRLKDMGQNMDNATPNTALSYIQASNLANWNILKQSGMPTDMLDLMVRDPFYTYVGKMDDMPSLVAAMSEGSKMPQGVANNMAGVAKRMMTDPEHKGISPLGNKAPGNTHVVLREMTNSSTDKLISEVGGSSLSADIKALKSVLDDNVKVSLHPSYKELDGLEVRLNKRLAEMDSHKAGKIEKLQSQLASVEDKISNHKNGGTKGHLAAREKLQSKILEAEHLKGGTPAQRQEAEALLSRIKDNKQYILSHGPVEDFKYTKGSLAKAGFKELSAENIVDYWKARGVSEGKFIPDPERAVDKPMKRLSDLVDKEYTGDNKFIKETNKNYRATMGSLQGGSGAEKRAMYVTLKEKVRTGKELTPKEQSRLDDLEIEVSQTAGGTVNPNPDADGFIYLRGSYHSSAKELGGVGYNIAIKVVDSGDPSIPRGTSFTQVMDRHDILGVDPMGGSGLITLTNPMQDNLFVGNKRGTQHQIGRKPTTTNAQAAENVSARTGIPLGASGKVPGASPAVQAMVDTATLYKPKPQARDYISAGGNVARDAAMLTYVANRNKREQKK